MLRMNSLLFPLALLLSWLLPVQPAHGFQDRPRQDAPDATITLIHPGVGDLQPLRWDPAFGVPVRAKLTMGMDMFLALDGEALPDTELPDFVFVISTTAHEADEDGLYRVETVYESVGLEGEADAIVRETLLEAMRPLEGASISFRMNDRGVVTDTDLDGMPAQVLQMLGGEAGARQMIETLSHPLPDEPVGLGARWQLEQTIRSPNAPVIKNRVVYELVRRDGDRVLLRMEGDQEGEEQEFDIGVPGASATLQSARGSFAGEVFMRLDRLVPLQARNEGGIRFEFLITERGVTRRMDQVVDLRVTIELLDAGGVKPVEPDDAG